MNGVLYFINYLMVSRWGMIKYTCFEISSQIYIACIIYCCFVGLFVRYLFHVSFSARIVGEFVGHIYVFCGVFKFKNTKRCFFWSKIFPMTICQKNGAWNIGWTNNGTNCLLAYFYLCFLPLLSSLSIYPIS